jgi:hypothetical protein
MKDEKFHELLKSFFLNKLQNQNFEGIKGVSLTFHIPIQASLLNFIFRTTISSTDAMNDFESVQVSELYNDELLVKVNHKKINRTVRCKLHDLEFYGNSEPALTIEIIGGLRFYEKAALDSVTALKRGWKWIKSTFSEDKKALEEPAKAVKISGSEIIIQLNQLLVNQNLGYLARIIKWDRVSTRDNSLIIGFRINTE